MWIRILEVGERYAVCYLDMVLYDHNYIFVGIWHFDRHYPHLPLSDTEMGQLSDVRSGGGDCICAVFQPVCAGRLMRQSAFDRDLPCDCLDMQEAVVERFAKGLTGKPLPESGR